MLQRQKGLGLMRGFVQDPALQRRLQECVYRAGARLLLGVGHSDERTMVRARMRDLCGREQAFPEMRLVSWRALEVVTRGGISKLHDNKRLRFPFTEALLERLAEQRRAQPQPQPRPAVQQQPPRAPGPQPYPEPLELKADFLLSMKARNGVFDELQKLGNRRPGAKGVPRTPRPAAQKKPVEGAQKKRSRRHGQRRSAARATFTGPARVAQVARRRRRPRTQRRL
jgi:hypothetical protein